MAGKVLGFERVVANLNRKLERLGAVSKEALVDVGLDLWGEANKTAPKKTGDLRASAYLQVDGHQVANGENPPPSVSTGSTRPGRHEVRFGYSAPYALRLHEMPEFKQPTTPGTGPKWLERALTENQDRYVRHIARKTKEEVDRRGV